MTETIKMRTIKTRTLRTKTTMTKRMTLRLCFGALALMLVASAAPAANLAQAPSAGAQTFDGVPWSVFGPGDPGFLDFGQVPSWMGFDTMHCGNMGDCSSCIPVPCQTAADCCAACANAHDAACRAGFCIYNCCPGGD